MSNITVINATYLCHNYTHLPDVETYLKALSPYIWVLWSCGLLVLIATYALYVITMRSARHHWKRCGVSVPLVLAVYPIANTAGFLAIVVPRALLLAETVAQEYLFVGMYGFFCMIIAECGGPNQLVRKAGGAVLETRVTPCCCWPCCILPRPKLKKKTITLLRYLVLQMPVIQALIYMIILALWAEDVRVYRKYFLYLQPFVAVSILTGLWGLVMTARAARVRAGVVIRKRYVVLQLVLSVLKLQSFITRLITQQVELPCIVELHPSVFANMVNNSVMMLEMLLLSIWAWRIYRIPPVEVEEKTNHVEKSLLEDARTNVKVPENGVSGELAKL